MAEPQETSVDASVDYARAIGARLIEDGLLLAFDANTAQLKHANSGAIFLLEMSEDGLDAYTFQGLCAPAGGEDAADLWFELVAGARPTFNGAIASVLSGTSTEVSVTATLIGEDSDAPQVVLHCAKVEGGGGGGAASPELQAFAGLTEYLGVIDYDAEGRVIAANERAEMAMEYFGGDLVGKPFDAIWPADRINHPDYVEFWEKLRQGRIVEGRYRHVTGEGNEVWLQSTYVPLRSDDGMMTAVKQCLMDITDASIVAERHRRMVEGLMAATNLAEFDAEGHYKDASDQMVDLLGTKKDGSLIGRKINRFLEPEFARGDAFTRDWAAVTSGQAVWTDLRHVRDDGKPVWTRSCLLPIKGANGRVDMILEIAVDIDEMYTRLRETEMRYKAARDHVGMIEMSASGSVLGVNQAYLDALGLLESDILDKDYKTLVPNEVQHSHEFREFWDAICAGKSATTDVRRIGANGSEVWFHATYVPLRQPEDRRVRRIMCLTRTITDEKRRLSDGEGKIAAMEHFVGAAEYMPDGTLITASQSHLDLFGYQLEEVRDRKNEIFCLPEFVQSDDYSTMWRRLREGEALEIEDQRVTHSGETKWLSIHYSPLKDHNGKVQKVVELARDVSQRVLEVHALRTRIDAADNVFATIEFDLSGAITKVNDGALRMLGYSSREVVGQHHSTLVDSAESASQDYRDFWLSLGKGEGRGGLFRLRGRLEREFHVLGNYSPMTGVKGEVTGVVLFAMEVTDFVEFHKNSLASAEDVLTHIATLQSTLASGGADFGTLTEILASSQSAMSSSDSQLTSALRALGEMRESIKAIQDTVATVNEIATQTNLLAFNAAIEAARVGENGEGFSIVADEVRRLAERNSTAARDIMAQVNVMSERVEMGSGSSQTAAQSIRDGSEHVASIVERLEALIAVNSTQAQAANDVAAIVETIKSGAAAR